MGQFVHVYCGKCCIYQSKRKKGEEVDNQSLAPSLHSHLHMEAMLYNNIVEILSSEVLCIPIEVHFDTVNSHTFTSSKGQTYYINSLQMVSEYIHIIHVSLFRTKCWLALFLYMLDILLTNVSLCSFNMFKWNRHSFYISFQIYLAWTIMI